jgi:hypothetical protein
MEPEGALLVAAREAGAPPGVVARGAEFSSREDAAPRCPWVRSPDREWGPVTWETGEEMAQTWLSAPLSSLFLHVTIAMSFRTVSKNFTHLLSPKSHNERG